MALKIAIDLMCVPSQVRLHRAEPLPEGVLTLLRVAAGDTEAEDRGIDLSGRTRAEVRQASAFFVEQILFAPNADSYRVLGADPTASASELRRNVALLLRWLHPDLDPKGERSIFAGRVTAAWNDLKTPERRAAYDQLLRHHAERRRARSRRNSKGRFRPPMMRQDGMRQNDMRQNDMRQDHSMLHGAKAGFLSRILSTLFHRLYRPPYGPRGFQ